VQQCADKRSAIGVSHLLDKKTPVFENVLMTS